MSKDNFKILLKVDKEIYYFLSILFCALYVTSPIDVIPEMLISGPMGFMDDLIVLILIILSIVLRAKGVWIVDEKEDYTDVTFTLRGTTTVDAVVPDNNKSNSDRDTVHNPKPAGVFGSPVFDLDAPEEAEAVSEPEEVDSNTPYIDHIFSSIRNSEELAGIFSTSCGRDGGDDSDGAFW